ncbi:MAG: hypothetical protein NC822_01155 [Candidatus Omnitrophica bacterium]|nr:hypothetical protein [Candidatus Omnitrophota bacterium]
MSEERFFKKMKFTDEEIKGYLKNALKDLKIAKGQNIAEVKFNYAYTALLKSGIAIIAGVKNLKARTMPGHHIKILEMMSKILNDDSIFEVGNAMRMKRNIDLYGEGIMITHKESQDYYNFVEKVIDKVKKILEKK